MITQKRLKALLKYNPETGLFTRLVTRSSNANVGDIAGSFDCSQGYIKIVLDYKSYKAHRLAFLYMDGELPENQVDHIDHVRHNNRWINLRAISKSENLKNKSKMKNNTSGSTGVYWDGYTNKWRVRVMHNGKSLSVGSFRLKSKAVEARSNALIKYDYHENHGV